VCPPTTAWTRRCGRSRSGARSSWSTSSISTPRLQPSDDVWEDPDEWLEDGDIVRLESRVLRVIHTPGHTMGHVTFHDAEAGLLFSGDHVSPRITPSSGSSRWPRSCRWPTS
jgi:glyoxylase-like metal-dependent hydrolase (beta-lactamase superfamily II)